MLTRILIISQQPQIIINKHPFRIVFLDNEKFTYLKYYIIFCCKYKIWSANENCHCSKARRFCFTFGEEIVCTRSWTNSGLLNKEYLIRELTTYSQWKYYCYHQNANLFLLPFKNGNFSNITISNIAIAILDFSLLLPI